MGDFVIVPIGQDGDSEAPGTPDVEDIPPSASLADYFWYASSRDLHASAQVLSGLPR